MTNERRDEIVLIAIVLSVAIHVALMFFVKPRVMTHVSSNVPKTTHREPMHFTSTDEAPSPERIEEILDLKSLKDAPKAISPTEISCKLPAYEAPKAALDVSAFVSTAAEEVKPGELPPAKFAASPIKLDDLVSEKIPTAGFFSSGPIKRIKAPVITADPIPLTADSKITVASDPLPAPIVAPPEAPMKIEPKREPKKKTPKFTPADEVYEKVDEQVIEREKAAVRELVNANNAEELTKFVHTTMTIGSDGAWTYFKVMVTPRNSLSVVPKDLVVLIDASGSIGNERMNSIREAAKKILRGATNTGDRFNLVAFRDRFTYAFRSWQICNQQSFITSDRWLDGVAAHGRTDVFSTITSVLTLPRDPVRPLIALVITDGDANTGVRKTAEILSRFTALNDGLVSVYMYGVRWSANRELIDVLTHGNRGDSFIFTGSKRNAGEAIDGLATRFRDPVLSDLRLVFASSVKAEAFPHRLKNLYRGEVLEIIGRVPKGCKNVSFSLKGISGKDAYEGFFSLPISAAAQDANLSALWEEERDIDAKLH